MSFTSIPVAQLPKRQSKSFDADTAAALLEAVSGENAGNYASDSTAYATEAEARKIAQTHKRLLAHVAPVGQVAKSRTFPTGDGWAWGVTITAEKAASEDAPAPKKSKKA